MESEDEAAAAELTFDDMLGERSKFKAVGELTPVPVKDGEYAPLLP